MKRTGFQRGWALIDPLDDADPRPQRIFLRRAKRVPGEFREFEIFRRRALARRFRLPGQHVVPVEYRFPRRK